MDRSGWYDQKSEGSSGHEHSGHVQQKLGCGSDISLRVEGN